MCKINVLNTYKSSGFYHIQKGLPQINIKQKSKLGKVRKTFIK